MLGAHAPPGSLCQLHANRSFLLARSRANGSHSCHVRRSRHPRSTAAAAQGVNSGPGLDHPPVVVAGAGIAGLATALALHRAGIKPLVLERSPALRGEGSAIALWANAWRALDALGAGEQLRGSCGLLERIELVRSDGKLLRGFDVIECDAAQESEEASEFRGARRGALLRALAGALPDGALRLGCGVEAVEEDGGSGDRNPVVRLTDGSRLECSLVVGADGVGSAVATHLGLPPPNYAGYTAYRGVASFPPGTPLPVPLDTVRQIYGAGVRAGMYPLSESELYWFTCFNADEGAPAPSTLEQQLQEALSHVRGWSWGVEEAIRRTPPDALSRSRIRDRWTAGAFGRGLVSLAGDAAHPMTPNLGQGGCTALEDAVVLARELKQALDALEDKETAGAAAGPGRPQEEEVLRRQRLRRGALEAALRRYEGERWRRCLPLTVRAWAFGAALQLPYPPVTAARDLFMQKAFDPAHFLDHTAYDCGVVV